MDAGDCIRCADAPAIDGDGYCGRCHWIVRAEVAEGHYQLREYLDAWRRFAEWCAVHDAAA
jgi:hypothetical protein